MIVEIVEPNLYEQRKNFHEQQLFCTLLRRFLIVNKISGGNEHKVQKRYTEQNCFGESKSLGVFHSIDFIPKIQIVTAFKLHGKTTIEMLEGKC